MSHEHEHVHLVCHGCGAVTEVSTEVMTQLAERLGFIQNAAGAVPGPMDCWLALRGIKTLPLRMRQHDLSGRRVAEWLTHQRSVTRVYYPGLPSHPQFELASRQQRTGGGIVSFVVKGGREAAWRLIEYLSRPEQQQRFYELTGSLPARTAAWLAGERIQEGRAR